MKIKCRPSDFRVVELTNRVASDGPFAFYRLTKRSLGTLEALRIIARRWKIPPERISYGGLKDRHALTQQFVTIEQGPRESLDTKGIRLEYLGQTDRPFGPKDIEANLFKIAIRDLTNRGAQAAVGCLRVIQQDGVANYFDEQRFGSVGQSGEFVAQAWIRGDYERALWLAIADPHPHDRPGQRREKSILRENWGNWEACLRHLQSLQLRQVVGFLMRHSRDFKRALTKIDPLLRRLYLSAFQSFLWNRMLVRFLKRRLAAENLISIRLAKEQVLFYRHLDSAARQQVFSEKLPLPSSRLHNLDAATEELIAEVLQPLGLQRQQLRLRYPRDTFFSLTWRPVIFMPSDLNFGIHRDELYPNRKKLILRFRLPPGAYATILVKRLAAAIQQSG